MKQDEHLLPTSRTQTIEPTIKTTRNVIVENPSQLAACQVSPQNKRDAPHQAGPMGMD
jgi:hypothetical protein